MNKTISLALSGGAMRGFAHLGVLSRLEELSIWPKVVSGTSIGALVGVFVADGYGAEEIKEIFLGSKFSFELNYFRLNESLLSTKRLEEILKNNLRSRTFEELELEFYVCATDFNTGKAHYLNQGLLIPALLASSAIPMLYKPVRINDVLYVDGGLSQNLPAEPLIQAGLPIVGVHVNPLREDTEKSNVVHKIDHLVHLILRDKVDQARTHCTVYIEPEELNQYGLFETKSTNKMIAIGYEKAKEGLTVDLTKGLP